MGILYAFGIQLLSVALHIAAYFSPKARLWVNGRAGWRTRYARDFQKKNAVLWMHCASLGEFEQGRPVLEAFRAAHPDWQLVLTFFSPSGYEIRKDYPLADFVAYLPLDTRANARDFLDIIRPDIAVFVKYEFWANHLFALQKRQIRTYLVAALFRPGQAFFTPWGGFWRRVLACFTHVFVQNDASAALLRSIGHTAHSVAGDTRIDRVIALAQQVRPNAVVERFLAVHPGKKVLIAGSTWPKDEACLAAALSGTDWVCVIAPHEPTAANVAHLEALFPRTTRYSTLEKTTQAPTDSPVLLIDNIGMLNGLYQYGDVAYIGGGFGKGIHNTLEPAAFGLPVCFGPHFQKFEEARQFVATGGAFAVENPQMLLSVLRDLENPLQKKNASEAVKSYLEHNKGATDRIIGALF
jgi:3-deoxy-D-manno-octulosonic-acid transferase